MTGYVVKCERRCVRRLLAYISERHKPQLDQRLEAVAYTQSKTVALIEHLHDRLRYCGIAEGGGDEFTAAVRLVAAAESARECDYLSLLYRLDELLCALFYVACALIAYDKGACDRARPFKRTSGVVFAVGAGEHGNEYPGAGELGSARLFSRTADEIFHLAACGSNGREHPFQCGGE